MNSASEIAPLGMSLLLVMVTSIQNASTTRSFHIRRLLPFAQNAAANAVKGGESDYVN